MIKDVKNVTFSSVTGGYDAFLLRDIFAQNSTSVLYIVSDGTELERVADTLEYIAPNVEVLRFPAWDTVPYDRSSPNAALEALRVETLGKLVQKPTQKRMVIASVSSMLQKLPPQEIFASSVLELKKGQSYKLQNFVHYLQEFGYAKVDNVMEAHEFALRGDIIDVFPPATSEPLRIDWFDDDIERLRTFDVMTQRSTGEVLSYTFGAAGEVVLNNNTITNFRSQYRENFGASSQKDELYESISQGIKFKGLENWLPLFYDKPLISFFDYLPNATVIVGKNVAEAVRSKADSVIDHFTARKQALKVKSVSEAEIYRPVNPESFYLTEAEFDERIADYNAAHFTALNMFADEATVDVGILPMRSFSKNNVINELKTYLEEYKKLSRIIFCFSAVSRERLFHILSDNGIENTVYAANFAEALQKAKHSVVLLDKDLDIGFKAGDLCLFSESYIFGERRKKPQKKITNKDFIADISTLAQGELVVHIEHGIGKFLGLETITAGGSPHDCLKILYNDDAKLYVPVENIEVLSRYGFDDDNITLDTLGGSAWSAKKAKVKERLKEIAEKLIKLAAERMLKTADVYQPQDGMYEEFCATFPYSETDDQLKAIDEVVKDLGKGIPMDRLVCGDVGFGKTEVAMRAAFAVASSGAQVALVVPTTLLARQHYQNFKERFAGFPIRIKMLSRLVTAAEAKKTKEELKNGAVEIVIGTHALLAKDIEFCNLGMLIIDEEQHFGVAHKEKLKSLKSDVHVLTLTATPIPRTLQLSLTGVKQLSIIGTPPVDRLAVRSFVMPFDKVQIKEAIYREKFRGGQSFFICPRVSDIGSIQKELAALVPDIKILVAHGQMPAKELEDVMTAFADGKADMLLSTTIIESGIDMPRVNTMIIYRADMFGLAQLYQLKGRIGRSKTRGYCYFTVPSQKQLKPLAMRRLEVLQALDSLGAGFSLASYDMDIRGSGNVLGEEQSGHIKDVGMALYQHMLEEEILRQKNEAGKQTARAEWSPQINVNIPIQIPESYIADLSVRLGLYKRMGDLQTAEEIFDFKEELNDRFGAIPQELINLLDVVGIKQLCRAVNVQKIDAGTKGLLLTFKDNIFGAPEKLIDFVAKMGGKVIIRPDMKLFIASSSNNLLETMAVYLTKLKEML